jgi:hypothetical protein
MCSCIAPALTSVMRLTASRRHGAKDLNMARAPIDGPRGSSNDGQEQAMIVLEEAVKNRGRGGTQQACLFISGSVTTAAWLVRSTFAIFCIFLYNMNTYLIVAKEASSVRDDTALTVDVPCHRSCEVGATCTLGPIDGADDSGCSLEVATDRFVVCDACDFDAGIRMRFFDCAAAMNGRYTIASTRKSSDDRELADICGSSKCC